jgi:hypothetical protein
MKLIKPPHPFDAPDGKRSTTITIDHSTHAQIKAIADRQRRSISAQVEIYIEAGIALEKGAA